MALGGYLQGVGVWPWDDECDKQVRGDPGLSVLLSTCSPAGREAHLRLSEARVSL